MTSRPGGSDPDAPASSVALDDERVQELAFLYSALGDPVRLRLLSILVASETGEVCACDFVDPLGRSQPTVSHHLKVLAQAGLVRGEKRGRWVWYSIVPERLDTVRGALRW